MKTAPRIAQLAYAVACGLASVALMRPAMAEVQYDSAWQKGEVAAVRLISASGSFSMLGVASAAQEGADKKNPARGSGVSACRGLENPTGTLQGRQGLAPKPIGKLQKICKQQKSSGPYQTIFVIWRRFFRLRQRQGNSAASNRRARWKSRSKTQGQYFLSCVQAVMHSASGTSPR